MHMTGRWACYGRFSREFRHTLGPHTVTTSGTTAGAASGCSSCGERRRGGTDPAGGEAFPSPYGSPAAPRDQLSPTSTRSPGRSGGPLLREHRDDCCSADRGSDDIGHPRLRPQLLPVPEGGGLCNRFLDQTFFVVA